MKRLVIFLFVIALLASGYLYRHSLKAVVKSVYVVKSRLQRVPLRKGCCREKMPILDIEIQEAFSMVWN